MFSVTCFAELIFKHQKVFLQEFFDALMGYLSMDWIKRFEIIKENLLIKYFDGNIKKFSPKIVEESLGLTRNKWQKWKNGQIPSAEDMAILVNKLGISAHWLLTGEGDPYGTVTPCSQTTPNEEYEKNIALLQKEIADLKEKCELQRELITMYKKQDKGEAAFASMRPTVDLESKSEQ